jgi:hypothetical protein
VDESMTRRVLVDNDIPYAQRENSKEQQAHAQAQQKSVNKSANNHRHDDEPYGTKYDHEKSHHDFLNPPHHHHEFDNRHGAYVPLGMHH